MLSTKQYQQGLVSFLCLSYNHANFLEKCLESICAQNYEHIEIIALDDGSSDASPQLLQGFAESSPLPMKVILQENSGNVPLNFNTLRSEARGEYLFMLSMDDYFEPDAISSKLPFFEKDSQMCFVSNSVKNTVDEDGNTLEEGIPLIEWNKRVDAGIEELIEGTVDLACLVALQGTMFRSSIIDVVGGFDDDLIGDDVVLFSKILRYMRERPELHFKILDKAAINYRLHQSNISKDNVRMACLFVEWRNRYHSDSPISARLFLNFKAWLADAIVHGQADNAFAFVKLFSELLENESADVREHFINQLFESTDRRRRYLIPFLFEIKERKNLSTHRITFIVLGFKVFDLVFKRFAGRDCIIIKMFNSVEWNFAKKINS